MATEKNSPKKAAEIFSKMIKGSVVGVKTKPKDKPKKGKK